MATRIILKENGLINTNKVPEGYRYLGYENGELTESFNIETLTNVKRAISGRTGGLIRGGSNWTEFISRINDVDGDISNMDIKNDFNSGRMTLPFTPTITFEDYVYKINFTGIKSDIEDLIINNENSYVSVTEPGSTPTLINCNIVSDNMIFVNVYNDISDSDTMKIKKEFMDLIREIDTLNEEISNETDDKKLTELNSILDELELSKSGIISKHNSTLEPFSRTSFVIDIKMMNELAEQSGQILQ